MKTRIDYLEKKCTHREYYAQFVTEGVKKSVLRIGKDKLLSSIEKDIHLNNIPLVTWDMLAKFTVFNTSKLKEAGDSCTLAGCVCILKEAARQICES